MKDFLQRNVTLLSAIVVVSFIAIFILMVLLIGAKELQEQTLERVDRPPVTSADLPGPKNSISERSQREIVTLLANNPIVFGVYVARIHYEKTENPIFFSYSREPMFTTLLSNYDAMQKSGRGFSSAELDARNPQSFRNTEEAKLGLIKCDSIFKTNIPQLAPGIEKLAPGQCRATIPPFDENVNLAIVVLLRTPGNINTAEIQEVRRILLQLQIDIYNRDFQGRETWAHP